MSVELATGYISLVVETSKIPPAIAKTMKGVEAQGDATGRGWGEKFAGGVGGLLSKSALGAGVAAGAALTAGLTKGVGRLAAIEQAQAKLSGLGNSASAIQQIMVNANAAVRGTAFGLDEAATVAAATVAAGIKPGRELEGVLKVVADTASIAGTSMGDMGTIFGKVAATGRLQGDEVLQLAEHGIPVLSLLAKHLGTTSDDVQDLVKKGKVSFKEFADAMQEGMGGAALKSGETTMGALRNLWAGAGRLGATLAGPFYTQAGAGFRGLTTLLDQLDAKAKPVMANLERSITGQVVPGLKELAHSGVQTWQSFAHSDLALVSLSRLGVIFEQLHGTVSHLSGPVTQIIASLGQASAALGVSSWDILLSTLEATAAIVDATLVPALQTVAGLMHDNQGAVMALTAGFLAFKTVPTIMGTVTGALSPMVSGVKTGASSMAGFTGALRDSYRWAGQANPQLGAVGKTMTVLGANGGVASSALGGLKSAGAGLLGVFGGPLGAAFTGVTIAATAGIGANQKLKNAQSQLETSSKDLALAQVAMWDQIGNASGVSDAVVKQVQAVHDSLSAAMSGEQRGFGAWVKRMWSDFGSGMAAEGDRAGFEGTDTQNRANAIHDAAARAKDSLDQLKMSDKQIAAQIAGSAGDWTAFIGRLRGTANGGADAVAQVQPLRDEFVRMQQAEALATPGAQALSEAVGVLADKSATANDKLAALRRALQALGILESDAQSGAFELAQAVDKVVQSAKQGADAAGGLGSELVGLDGRLNPTKANAQALHTELKGLGDQFQAQAKASGDAVGTYATLGPALETLATKYNLPIEKVREFAAQAGGITPEIQTMIRVNGADESRQMITTVALELSKIPEGQPKTVTMRVESEAARASLRDLGLKVDAVAGQPSMVHITAQNEVAVAAINAVSQRLSGIDGKIATPKIAADDTKFRVTDAAVLEHLQQLDTSQVDPKVGAIIDKFINGRDVTLAELAKINATTADPTITAEISQALAKAKIINDALDNAARNRESWISAKMTSTIDGTTATVGNYYGRAAGGRLPTSGPGTDVVDGFLGVTASGMPLTRVDAGEWVTNAKSSEKYNGVLGAINRDDPSVQHLQGLAGGGVAGADELLDFVWGRSKAAPVQPLEGDPYRFGGMKWGDCSSTQAHLARFAVGLPPFTERAATGNMGSYLDALGFLSGRGGPDDLEIGWTNNPSGPGGGHAIGRIASTNIEMGGSYNAGKIGGASGPGDPFFQDHRYLPLGSSFDWSDKPFAGRRGTGLTIGGYSIDAFLGAKGYSKSGDAEGPRPKSLSEIAGNLASSFVGGQVEDLTKVLGASNSLPPILQAYQEMVDALEQIDSAKSDQSGTGLSTQSDRTTDLAKLDLGLDKQGNRVTDLEDKVADARRALNAAKVENDKGTTGVKNKAKTEDQRRKDVERVTDAEAKLAKVERDLAMAKRELAARETDAARKSSGTTPATPDSLIAQDVGVGPYDATRGAEQWSTVIDKVLQIKGQPLSARDAVIFRGNKESRGDPDARNDWDSNAAAGNPSEGWMQMTRSTFQAYADPEYQNFHGVEDQLRASINYVTRDPKYAGRSLTDVFMQAGGYYRGGTVTAPTTVQPGVDNVLAALTPGEKVVPNGPAQRYASEIDSMIAGSYQPAAGPSFHFQVLSMEEAERRASAINRQYTAQYLGGR